ncbi:RNA polymerase sigma factor [bacterium]|nr:RNA polymerase sigma factor [bacterium]
MAEHAIDSTQFDIVRKCMEGDQHSFRRLFDMYKDRVYTTSCRLLGNAEDAEDATQEIFIRIYHNIKKFRGDSSVFTWIYRITVNTCIEHMRKRKKERGNESLDEMEEYSSVPSSHVSSEIVKLIVEREIEELPDNCRAVFVLHIIEGFKHNEIAEMLGISDGTSKSQLSYAKSRLREKLLPYMEVIYNEL